MFNAKGGTVGMAFFSSIRNSAHRQQPNWCGEFARLIPYDLAKDEDGKHHLNRRWQGEYRLLAHQEGKLLGSRTGLWNICQGVQ
jgi:hypothetical protein